MTVHCMTAYLDTISLPSSDSVIYSCTFGHANLADARIL